MKGIVYIAGPMTVGVREENLRKGLEAAEQIWQLGFGPFVPHLAFFYNDSYPHSWEEWLEYDETIIKSACCAIFRVEGESKGADREVEFANYHHIPVFYTIEDFKNWAITRDKETPPKDDGWMTVQGTTLNYGPPSISMDYPK